MFLFFCREAYFIQFFLKYSTFLKCLVVLGFGFFVREVLVLYPEDVQNLPVCWKDAAGQQIKFPRWISGKCFIENKEVDLQH